MNPGYYWICGMALESEMVSSGALLSHELVDISRRFWIVVLLRRQVFILQIGGYVSWLGLCKLIWERWPTWIECALTTPLVLWAWFASFQRVSASLLPGT